MTAIRSRTLSLAAIWLLFPVVGIVVAATLEPGPPHDYWWHLAMGRLVGVGTLPSSNLFLYTLPADLPFVNQPWLGQWLMWVTYDIFGHGGPVVLRNILLAVGFAIVIATAWQRSGDARAAGALGLLAGLVAYPVLTVRTRMFAFVPFALVVWVCLGVAERRLSRRWLAAVPLATLIWANVHGSFILAPVIVAMIGLGFVIQHALEHREFDVRQAAMWAIVFVLVLLAGAVTPLGFGVYSYVVQLTVDSTVAHSVTEWLPPDVTELRGQLFAAAVLLSLGILGWRRRDVGLAEVFLFAGTLLLALGAVRSMYWWAAVMPIVVAPHLAALLPAVDDSTPSRRERYVVGGGLALAFAVLLAVQPGIGRVAIGELTRSGHALHSGEGAWVLNYQNALVATRRLMEDRRTRVFHDQVLGGMLEVMLTTADAPAQVAYVDQRMEFVPDAVWDRYFALSAAAPGWQRELTRLGVDTMLLSVESQWALLQAALASDAWELVAVDHAHVLLYHRSLDRAQHPAKEHQAEHEEGEVHRDHDP